MQPRTQPNLTHPEAVALAATLRWGFYSAHVAWDATSVLAPHYRIVFTGGEKGDHSLAISCSSEARVMAHWDGYTNSTPTDRRRSMVDEARLKQQAAWASACLVMVSCHVAFKDGGKVHCYLLPWECFERARAFTEIGAVGIALYGASTGVGANWTRPAPFKVARVCRKVRGPRALAEAGIRAGMQVAPARLDADRTGHAIPNDGSRPPTTGCATTANERERP
jgi:hypothetical protein